MLIRVLRINAQIFDYCYSGSYCGLQICTSQTSNREAVARSFHVIVPPRETPNGPGQHQRRRYQGKAPLLASIQRTRASSHRTRFLSHDNPIEHFTNEYQKFTLEFIANK